MKYKIQRAITIYNQRGLISLLTKACSLIRGTLLLPFQLTVYLVSKIAPKDEDVWIFGYGQGEEFTDNAKHLFLYASENTEKKAIWLSRDSDIVEMLEEDHECYHFWSLKGAYYTLRAKYAFICNTRRDVPWWFTGRTDIVMLQHGIPVAKAYWDNDSKVSQFGLIRRPFNKHVMLNFDHSIATSEFMRDYICGYCNLSPDKVFVTGMPRLDMFHSPEYDYSLGSEKVIDKLDSIDSDKNIVMYSPTWSKTSRSSIDEDTVRKLDSLMDEINSVLVVRPHRNDEFRTDSDLSNTVFLEQDTDFYPIFLELDLLITNYSSIFWDALYSDVPINFFLPEELKGKKFEKMYFDYDSLPGRKSKSFEDLEDSIRKSIHDREEFSSENRREWKDKVFQYKSGGNCKRIVEKFNQN